VTNDLPWASSGGGPLLAIDSALAQHWRGVLPPEGAVVPPGWTWGDDGGVRCDYDRACDDMEDVVTVGDLIHTWSIPVATGRALVLDGEISTTAFLRGDDVMLLRNAPVDFDARRAHEVVTAVAASAWVASAHVLDLTSGALFIFDAAAPGACDAALIDTSNGVVRVDTRPGRYRAWFASGPTDPDLALIRLARG
jgi:hypothetical protein